MKRFVDSRADEGLYKYRRKRTRTSTDNKFGNVTAASPTAVFLPRTQKSTLLGWKRNMGIKALAVATTTAAAADVAVTAP